jgi:hypothetical protein
MLVNIWVYLSHYLCPKRIQEVLKLTHCNYFNAMNEHKPLLL